MGMIPAESKNPSMLPATSDQPEAQSRASRSIHQVLLLGRRAGSLACFAVAIAMAGPATANAATSVAPKVCVEHPSEPSVACVRNGATGETVDICDRSSDGHSVWARVITIASYPNFQSTSFDGNGSTPGCAHVRFPSPVVRFAVCANFDGCSGYKAVRPPPVIPDESEPVVPDEPWPDEQPGGSEATTAVLPGLAALACRVLCRPGARVVVKFGRSVASRSSNAIKRIVKREARRRHVPYPQVKRGVKRATDLVVRVRRSRAWRTGKWSVVAAVLVDRLAPAAFHCLVNGAAALVGGQGFRAAIAACVAGFVTRISESRSTGAGPATRDPVLLHGRARSPAAPSLG